MLSGKDSKDFMLAGVISGVVTKTALAPLDRIRLLYQVQGMFNIPKVSGSRTQAGRDIGTAAQNMQQLVQRHKYPSLFSSVAIIYREEGIPGLWRGNLANIMRASLVYVCKFGTNDVIKEALGKRSQGGQNSVPSTATLSYGNLLLAGLSAGIVQKSLSYPADLLSVRVVLGVNSQALGSEKIYYVCVFAGGRDCICAASAETRSSVFPHLTSVPCMQRH
eukprot:GHVU01234319.1.p1 GENE.GHVU01234319.1~~GHVU01234319.1.p1  ORF type:complete len:220 (+),score=15.51 GHVU01234319.1:57-716(+)